MKHILLIIFLVISQISFSQNLNPYQLSNYSGVYGLGYNPASIADTRYSFHLNLGAMAGSFGQNVLDNSYLPFSNKTFSFNKIDFKTERIDVLGPSLMIQLPKGNSFAISTKYRAGQFADSEDIKSFFENDGSSFSNSAAYYKSVSTREIAFSYAHPFSFKNHFLKAGASLKLEAMAQLTNIGFQNGNFLTDKSALSSSIAGEYTGDVYFQTTNKKELSVSNLLKNKNSGLGYDLGFIYEFRPKHEDFAYQMDGKTEYDVLKSKYLVKFAFSIMDLGQFDGSKIGANYQVSNLNKYIVDQNSVDGTVINDLSKLPLNNNVQVDGSSKVNLPKRINLFIDTKLGKNGWYMGLFTNSKVKTDSENSKNVLAPQSIFALIPRYEKEGFDLQIPLIYQKETKKYGYGLHLNLGSVFLGTESINSFFAKNSPNPTVYVGINILKLSSRIKDKDNDGVSDKEDICPDIKGLWAFKGCPDTDGDGIKDSEDDCPEHAGPTATKGCPDTDKDGIFDKNDACPNAAGPTKFNGCPDTDGDGLPDNEDECPTKAGSAEFGGCPDSDKDGLMDNEDECPELPGIKLLKGCPDTDGDGIADKNDACPNAKGSLANNGCPDTDGDGIIDKEDNCPTEAGSKANKGCPDTDNDGINDKNDSCPKEKGTLEYDGCPLSNYTKSNANLTTDQNDFLNKFTNEILGKSITDPTLEQLKKTFAALPNTNLIFVAKGSKSGTLKKNIENYLKEKLTTIPFEIIEENEVNGKTGLELRVAN